MWRRALVALTLAGVTAIAVLLLVGGGADPDRPGLTVSPSEGGPATRFAFSFRAPDASGRQGSTRLGYGLGIVGPARAGCLGSRSAKVPAVGKGAEVSLTLDPARLGGSWCPGIFAARVTEYERPVCGTGVMCPQFVRVIATVARASFRVRAP